MTMAATSSSEISHVGGPLGLAAAARIGRRAVDRGASVGVSLAGAGSGRADGRSAR